MAAGCRSKASRNADSASFQYSCACLLLMAQTASSNTIPSATADQDHGAAPSHRHRAISVWMSYGIFIALLLAKITVLDEAQLSGVDTWDLGMGSRDLGVGTPLLSEGSPGIGYS